MEEGGGSTQTALSVQPRKARTAIDDREKDKERLLVLSGCDRSATFTPHRAASHPSPDTPHPSISVTSHPTINTTAHSSATPQRINSSTSRPLISSDSTSHFLTSKDPTPLTSTDSTPSSSPSIHSKSSGKENRALGQVDLMSLAPENKQVVSAVKRGWSEGGGVTPEGGEVKAEKPAETATSIKEIARKMHGEF